MPLEKPWIDIKVMCDRNRKNFTVAQLCHNGPSISINYRVFIKFSRAFLTSLQTKENQARMQYGMRKNTHDRLREYFLSFRIFFFITIIVEPLYFSRGIFLSYISFPFYAWKTKFGSVCVSLRQFALICFKALSSLRRNTLLYDKYTCTFI